MEGVQHDGGQDQYCAVFVSRGCPVSGYSLIPPLFPPTLSHIMDHKTACPRACAGTHGVRARRAGDGSLERLNALWSSCVMRFVNSWWTCSDARNIGRYNSSPYDSIRYTQYRFRYDTDPIIVHSLTTHNALHFYYGSRLSLMVNGEIEFAFLGAFMPYRSHLLLMLCKFSRLYVYVYGRSTSMPDVRQINNVYKYCYMLDI